MTNIDQEKKCIVCTSSNTKTETIQSKLNKKQFKFIICNSCNLVRNPKNTHVYEKLHFTEGSIPGNSKRVGDGIRAGREYRMAETALQILNNRINEKEIISKNKEILIFGAGLSRDHELIKNNLLIDNIKITDTENFQNSDNYINILNKKKFDIVIASEVIEHFEDPEKDLSLLASKINKKGLIIASTNIHDGTDISRLVYPFSPGHVTYYSGKSLIILAQKLGLKVDFRLPVISQNKLGGPRKRYVLLYKSNNVHNLILDYFSKNCFALSE